MKAINTKTQEQYNELMRMFEEKWWKWLDWEKPTEKNYFNLYKENICIDYKDWFWYADIDFYKEKWNEIISFEEFLELEWITQEIKPWDLVWISDESQEKADKDFRDDADCYYVWKSRDWWFICEYEDTSIWRWKFISKKKPVSKEYTIEELEEKLWETIKLIK